MKPRIPLVLVAIALIALITFGQGKLVHDGTGDPSGFCNNAMYINTVTGEHWSCVSNAWSKDSAKVMMNGAVPAIYRSKGVNLNAGANTDSGSTFTGLPAKYLVRRLTFENASGTPTLSTVALRTASGGGGTAIVTAQALSSLSASNIALDSTLAITTTQTASTLYIRNVAAAGGAMTVDATLEITPLL